MRKSDLVKLLGVRHPGLTAADMAYCVELILSAIADGLAAGRRAEFRSFGVFHLFRSKGRKGRNPRSGAAVAVPSKNYVRFRSTISLEQVSRAPAHAPQPPQSRALAEADSAALV